MKGFKRVWLLLLTMVLANFAVAGIIVDTVVQREFVDWFGGYAYQHDLNDHSDFALGNVTGGSLEVSVWDDSQHWFDGPEVILFQVDALDWDSGGITFGHSFSGDLEFGALAALNTNGFLDVSIKSLMGDFYVGNSVLTLYSAVTDVAEPSTLGLLALGLAALLFSRRPKAPKWLA